MLDSNSYLYLFVSIAWVFYIFNSYSSNKKIKKAIPDKHDKAWPLTIPFYIFFYLTIFFTVERLIENNAGNLPALSTFFVFIGVFFCLFSIIFYIYVNFFEESFPSCIATKNNKSLDSIYKYVRHPSYYIFFSITFGSALCLLSPSLFFFACLNHICLYFHYMIEENQIRKTNSDYDSYLKKSNRFLPNFLKI